MSAYPRENTGETSGMLPSYDKVLIMLVLIVGAGVVGLTLAIMLASQGFQPFAAVSNSV